MTRVMAPSWQLVLADLALILFLVTLCALAYAGPETPTPDDQNPDAINNPLAAHVAQSQALFRPVEGGPSLAQWLAQRPRDQRATVTVFARHSGADHAAIWGAARALADDAARSGFAVRVVITSGPSSDLHASLAYDTAINAAKVTDNKDTGDKVTGDNGRADRDGNGSNDAQNVAFAG